VTPLGRTAPAATTPPTLLAIAGSDSTGGAGIQADIKTAVAFGVHPLCAVTALTAQNSQGVQSVWPAPPEAVRAQLRSLLDDVPVDAVKTGMLVDAATIAEVAAALREVDAPLVVDPVGASSHGDRLLTDEGFAELRRQLLPRATVVTPNLAEAAVLSGLGVSGEADMRAAAEAIMELGAGWVLVTGGHLPGEAPDLLVGPDGPQWLRGPRLPQRHAHGTGCSLASAIAAGLALGMPVADAARRAKQFVAAAIAAGYPLGAGIGPVNQSGTGTAGAR
jgi:hydroxymethylpyrimidine/phosphomethylpyrimidine kinase